MTIPAPASNYILDGFRVPRGVLAQFLTVLLGSIAIGILARIAIPVGPVPITGQTLGVFAVAALLGSRRGTVAVSLYILEGFLGLPVFAGGTFGPLVLAGPTAGYLLGFVPAAYLVGLVVERFSAASATGSGLGRWLSDHPVVVIAVAMVAGHVVTYTFGVAGLTRFVPWERVMTLGVLPFLPGDLLKSVLVIMLVTGVRPKR